MALAGVLILLVLTATVSADTALNKSCTGGDGADAGGGYSGGGYGTQLAPGLYSSSCPTAEDIVLAAVHAAVNREPRMAASLLRLHFHDCFVNGCDGSVLLDDTPAMAGEKGAGPNANSLRGFEVIDAIKADLEQACPSTVSCADILAIAARDAVVLSGGPKWEVELGRTDALTASLAGANSNIPAPTSTVPGLIQKFNGAGLSAADMVALSGAHTIGKARCSSFASRLTSSSSDDLFLQSLQQLCAGGPSNGTLAHLDVATPVTFDNQYFVNLMSGEGLLPSDQALVAGGDKQVAELVEAYAGDTSRFFGDFAASMVRMGRLSSGAGGEIRTNCRAVN